MRTLTKFFALCAVCLAVAGCAYDRRRPPEAPVEPAETWRDCPGVMEGGEPVAALARLDAMSCRRRINEIYRLLLGANIVFAEGMGGLERWTSGALKLLDHAEDNSERYRLLGPLTHADRALLYLMRGHISSPLEAVIQHAVRARVKARIDALGCRNPEFRELTRLEDLRYRVSQICAAHIAGKDPQRAVEAARHAVLLLLSDSEEAIGKGPCSRASWCLTFIEVLNEFEPQEPGATVAARYMQMVLAEEGEGW